MALRKPHPIFATLLILSAIAWIISISVFLTPDSSTLNPDITLWATLGITAITGFWYLQQIRIQNQQQSPQEIISTLGGTLIGWDWRQEQIKKTVHHFATQTALNDLGIKAFGQVINIASHSIAGTVIAAGWSMKRKWSIYQQMPEEIAKHLLGRPDTLPDSLALVASGSEQMLDLSIDYLFDHFISESLDQIISHAFEDLLHDITLSDLLPIIGPIKSAGVAYIYTWIVSFVYIAALVNFSLSDQEELNPEETAHVVAESKELLKDHLIKVGPIRIPVPLKQVEIEKVLEIYEVREEMQARGKKIITALRKNQPTITKDIVQKLIEQAQFPQPIITYCVSPIVWKQTAPNPFDKIQHSLWGQQ